MCRARPILAALSITVLLAACSNAGDGDVEETTGDEVAIPEQDAEPVPEDPASEDDPAEPDASDQTDEPDEPDGTDGTDGGTAAPDVDARVQVAITDLADDEGVDPASIEVEVAEETTWPDGSLGCPEPDGMYTQALVDGYRIVLVVDGREVAYHGAAGADPFRCDRPVASVDPDS